jgi:hypothetical protein
VVEVGRGSRGSSDEDVVRHAQVGNVGKYGALVGWFGRTLLEGVVGLLVVYFEENRGTGEKVGERV